MDKIKAVTCMMIVVCCLVLMQGCTNKNVPQDQALEITEKSMNIMPEEYRTEYIGDAPKVVGVASNLPYPTGFSYSSIEIQSDTKPYELTVFLDGTGNTQDSLFEDAAKIAFDYIGNLGIIHFCKAETKEEIALFDISIDNSRNNNINQFVGEWYISEDNDYEILSKTFPGVAEFGSSMTVLSDGSITVYVGAEGMNGTYMIEDKKMTANVLSDIDGKEYKILFSYFDSEKIIMEFRGKAIIWIRGAGDTLRGDE